MAPRRGEYVLGRRTNKPGQLPPEYEYVEEFDTYKQADIEMLRIRRVEPHSIFELFSMDEWERMGNDGDD